YISNEAGLNLPKPVSLISELFKNILIELEANAEPGWAIIGVALNRYSPMEQEKISNTIAEMELEVLNNWDSDDLENSLDMFAFFRVGIWISFYIFTIQLFLENMNLLNLLHYKCLMVLMLIMLWL
ncbi:hypothetical protein LEP1GSC151_0557, partial [Leptospira interrogans serovar Grippotyphosa str. LT2186]